MSVSHQQMINRPSVHHAYYPTSTPIWAPTTSSSVTSSSSTLVCPISSHPNAKLYSSLTYSRSDQLRIRIHENHLSYLSRDETPFKSELRSKIESLITDYLSQIPHSQKFSFKEIGTCLSESIKRPDFDPSKAIVAFEAIERYATNLLNYPWRSEFRTIFAFCGHFYRVIECTLTDYKAIFELLGFTFDSTECIFQLTEVPIDPDKISKVSLECLVAIVECKIMLAISSKVKALHGDISWKDIHSVRTDYICNSENAVKLIADLKITGKLIDLDQPDYSVSKFNRLDVLSPANGGKTIFDELLPPPVNYLESNLDSIDFIDGSGAEQLTSPLLSSLPKFPVANPSTTTYSTTSINDFSGSSGRSGLPSSSQPAEGKSTNDYLYGRPDLAPSHRASINKQLNSSNCTPAPITFQSVYPADSQLPLNVEEKARVPGEKYSDIDPVLLAEINQFEVHKKNLLLGRTDIERAKNGAAYTSATTERKQSKGAISEPAKGSEQQQQRSQQQQQQQSTLDRGYVQIVNCYPKNGRPTELDHGTGANSAIMNNSSPGSNSTGTVASRIPLKVKVKVANTGQVGHVPASIAKASPSALSSSPSRDSSTGTTLVWSCKSCTYKNPSQRDICEMCHKSRRQGPESQPLVSGGRECSRCTLVNGKEEQFCKVCDTSLADSPTYI